MAESVTIYADDEYTAPVEAEKAETEDVVDPETVDSGDEEVEIEVEGKAPVVESEDSKVTQLESTIRELQQELLRVSSRINQPAEPAVMPPKEEERLTKAQLKQILVENADNPDVLLNVVDYIAEQKTKEVKKQAFEELNNSSWERELAGTANQVLAEDKDGYLAKNPQVKDKIGQVMKNLRLEKHPAGALAAYALIRFGEGLGGSAAPAEKAVEKAANKGKMDKTRTPAKVAAGNKKLTPEHLEMAKKLGIKDPNLMARFIP